MQTWQWDFLNLPFLHGRKYIGEEVLPTWWGNCSVKVPLGLWVGILILPWTGLERDTKGTLQRLIRVVCGLWIAVGLWRVLPEFHLEPYFHHFTLFHPHWPPLSFFSPQVLSSPGTSLVLCSLSRQCRPQLFTWLVGPFHWSGVTLGLPWKISPKLVSTFILSWDPSYHLNSTFLNLQLFVLTFFFFFPLLVWGWPIINWPPGGPLPSSPMIGTNVGKNSVLSYGVD